MEPSEHLKEYSRDKLLRLEKYLDSVLDADVTFTVEKFRHKAEAVLSSDGLKIKAEEETEDMYSALDLVVDKLEKQIKRHREKLKGHNKGPGGSIKHLAESERPSGGNGSVRTKPESPSVTTDRVRDLPLSLMGIDEARDQLTHSSTPFVVFIDRDEGGIRLLHQSGGGALELLRYHQN
jgi:putative sigma-54 modulation protein